MASKGTKNTAISFGSYTITVALHKAHQSRDIKTAYVNEAGEKVTMSGSSGGGSRTVAPGVHKAADLGGGTYLPLPEEELDAIVEASQERWQQMRVLETIDYRQVPTERILGSYWLQPAAGTAQGLLLLHMGLTDTDRVAVVKWIGSSREKLGVLRPRRVGGKRALLLSEIAFANDFADPDSDALSINEAEAMLGDSVAAREAAQALVEAFARERGDEQRIDTASDEAVDARLALVQRLQAGRFDEQLDELEAALEAAV